MIERILSQPAPVPVRDSEPLQRQPVSVGRDRLLGDNSHSTPVDRAIAALIRALPVSAVMVFVGFALAFITGLSGEVVVATVIAVLGTLVYYNHQEYKHSQAGVERQRSKHDHQLDIEHERNRHTVESEHEANRHTETMAAISNDHELKMKVLEIGQQFYRLADRNRE